MPTYTHWDSHHSHACKFERIIRTNCAAIWPQLWIQNCFVAFRITSRNIKHEEKKTSRNIFHIIASLKKHSFNKAEYKSEQQKIIAFFSALRIKFLHVILWEFRAAERNRFNSINRFFLSLAVFLCDCDLFHWSENCVCTSFCVPHSNATQTTYGQLIY